MEIMKKISMVVLVLIMFIILAPYILMIHNPMRRPPEMARNYVLRLTPIGMDIEEVIEILDGHRNWHVNSLNFSRGFPYPTSTSDNFIGVKSIFAWGYPSGAEYWPAPIIMPIYGWFFRTSVSIFWGFDEDGKLIDVFVRQSHSG